jgi:hypothetical protein
MGTDYKGLRSMKRKHFIDQVKKYDFQSSDNGIEKEFIGFKVIKTPIIANGSNETHKKISSRV